LSADRVALAREIIGRFPDPRSALIPLVHLAQEQDGYVAEDAMEHIGELVGATPAEVSGTATFYEMFKFHPVGRYVVGICTNISCLLAGADDLLQHAEEALGVRAGATTADGAFTLEEVECIAGCTIAPCVQVNYRYFAPQTAATLDQLLEDLRAGRLDAEVPPHGVLSRVRQQVAPDRWAGTFAAPPPIAERYPGPALVASAQGAAASGPTDAATSAATDAAAAVPGAAPAPAAEPPPHASAPPPKAAPPGAPPSGRSRRRPR
jgi:NADH-quinone oxidoreductase subunit E